MGEKRKRLTSTADEPDENSVGQSGFIKEKRVHKRSMPNDQIGASKKLKVSDDINIPCGTSPEMPGMMAGGNDSDNSYERELSDIMEYLDS
ncbi:hypothetical protein F443_14105, partial [Phytophthora nicotianae P1569]